MRMRMWYRMVPKVRVRLCVRRSPGVTVRLSEGGGYSSLACVALSFVARAGGADGPTRRTARRACVTDVDADADVDVDVRCRCRCRMV